MAVARAIADREGRDPGELRPPLEAVIDADALNALAGTGDGADARVTFRYRDYEVTVEGGRVSLAPAE